MKSQPMKKSSVAVFSSQGDPFPAQGRSRTHYHPSQAHTLSEDQKQTVLSPDRLRLPRHLSEALSPADLSFLGGSQRLVPAHPESDSSGPFDESWPTSEGSSKTPENDGRPGARTMERPKGSESAEDSVIAKYIARFRHGHPTSRIERSPPQSSGKDFWWLQVSPDSPDAQRQRPSSGFSSVPGSSPQSLDRTPPLGESSLCDPKLQDVDMDVLGLQQRAGTLILRSESSLSSVGAVSSEGLGSSPLSGTSSSDRDGIRTIPSTLDTAPVVPVLRPSLLLPVTAIQTHPTLAPEEDILYQWRLRRKMEQAREGTLPVTTRRRSPSPPVRIPKQVSSTVESSILLCPAQPPEAVLSSHVPSTTYLSGFSLASPSLALHPTVQQEIPTSCLGGFPLASPSLASHSPSCTVPPHLHLLCDILRCAHSQQTIPLPVPEQKEQAKPVTVHGQEAATRSAGTEIRCPPKERQEKAMRKAGRTHERTSSNRRIQDRKGSSQLVKTIEAPVPQSPVTRAMEQVISERLFSPAPSPQQKSTMRPGRPVTPPTEEDEELRPVEIAAHLLEEAEDSDGTEFADDPLLLVLREQRESLRLRIRTVDMRLAELEMEEREH